MNGSVSNNHTINGVGEIKQRRREKAERKEGRGREREDDEAEAKENCKEIRLPR